MMGQIRRRQAVLVVVLVLITATLPRPQISHAAGIVVNSLADTAVAGDGQCTLREAILNVNAIADVTNGDCASGITTLNTVTFSLSGTILLTVALPTLKYTSQYYQRVLVIDGTGQEIVLDGAGNYSIFFTSISLTLIELTLQNALSRALQGNADMEVIRCTFRNNLAPGGGGAIMGVGSAVVIRESTFFDNQASAGGVIYMDSGPLTVIESTFHDNSATTKGGTIYSAWGKVTVTGSTFYSNTAGEDGGAIYRLDQSNYNTNNTIVAANSTFYNNSAGRDGGGIFNLDGLSPHASLANVTLVENHAAGTGGALYGKFSLSNTIVGNNPSSGYACATSKPENLVDTGGNLQYPLGDCMITIPVINPNLGNFGDHGGPTYTIPPLEGSAAIGRGLSQVCAASPVSGKDQRGVTRKPNCDSGAFEVIITSVSIYQGGNWWLGNPLGQSGDTGYVWYGGDGWMPVVGDWDGDGKDSPGIFKDGNWWLRSDLGESDSERYVWYGGPDWKPIVGDWDGDGKDSPGIVGGFAGGQWWLRQDMGEEATELELYTWYGDSSWTPVVGDWDGDSKDSPGIFKDGNWWLHSDYGEPIGEQYVWYGGPGWAPIAGDWDWDGKDSPGIFQAGNWWLRSDLGEADPEQYAWYGGTGWTPVAGRWKQ